MLIMGCSFKYYWSEFFSFQERHINKIITIKNEQIQILQRKSHSGNLIPIGSQWLNWDKTTLVSLMETLSSIRNYADDDEDASVGFYILATSRVTSGQVPTCNSTHSQLLYSAPLLGSEASRAIVWLPTQTHYPNTEISSPCPIPVIRLARK